MFFAIILFDCFNPSNKQLINSTHEKFVSMLSIKLFHTMTLIMGQFLTLNRDHSINFNVLATSCYFMLQTQNSSVSDLEKQN